MLSRPASSLFADLDVTVVPDAEVGAMTWYGIGGRADLLVRPRTVEGLGTLARRCARTGTPLRVLGAGANLLVADEGVGGIVVRLDEPALRAVTFDEDAEGPRLRAMAGADMARTLMDATRRGLAGLAPMAGIPATIGGAVRMNAGGAYGAIGDVVAAVTCLTRHGDVVTYPASELRFDYRATNIPDPVILSVDLRLEPDDPVALRDRVKEIFRFKKSSQPLAEHSAGCAFRNPWDPVREERVPAGRLIDEAGLKGLTVGGASVSRHHANFIVTVPGATADDVLRLMEDVQRRVFEHVGLELEREVVVWRRDEPEVRTVTRHDADRLGVLVLSGGPDAERAVSLDSGAAVSAALAEAGCRVVSRVIDRLDAGALRTIARAEAIDVVFPALHGRWGEGGGIQGELDAAGLAYVGADAASAALAMDKLGTKAAVAARGVRTPAAAAVAPDGACPIAPPLVLKPIDDGSSVDLRICRTAEDVAIARAHLHPRRGPLMAERYIAGREVTVGVLDGALLPIIEIVPAVEYYDYDAKYERDDTRYVPDPDLPDAVRLACLDATRAAWDALRCRDLGRADFMIDAEGAWFLELNTMPGFTTHSLVPMAARHAGLEMPALCGRLVEAARRRTAPVAAATRDDAAGPELRGF